jgi:hypothetical protein
MWWETKIKETLYQKRQDYQIHQKCPDPQLSVSRMYQLYHLPIIPLLIFTMDLKLLHRYWWTFLQAPSLWWISMILRPMSGQTSYLFKSIDCVTVQSSSLEPRLKGEYQRLFK